MLNNNAVTKYSAKQYDRCHIPSKEGWRGENFRKGREWTDKVE